MSDSRSGGIGLPSAVFIVLLTLKLTGQIDWSWVWIFSPYWGCIVLFVFVVFVVHFVAFLLKALASFFEWLESLFS